MLALIIDIDASSITRRSPTPSATLGLMNARWRFLGMVDQIHKHFQRWFEA